MTPRCVLHVEVRKRRRCITGGFVYTPRVVSGGARGVPDEYSLLIPRDDAVNAYPVIWCNNGAGRRSSRGGAFVVFSPPPLCRPPPTPPRWPAPTPIKMKVSLVQKHV
ncbi:hypothetical protein EVAR_25719_1 [Eumeta japonica]|uniref:Uncharacterized protein n=1 Tax=Eumeta variegata TaxID=151549 RepID=A0A4C1YTT5_EUMVA|nr:hypothetical protein EVAR_25719_1 [Eumeta japonica]